MSDSTPTKVLPTTPPTGATTPIAAGTQSMGTPPPPTRPPRPPKPQGPSRAPMIAFIVIAVLVFVALAILGGILLSRAGTPAASPSNSPSSTPATPGTFTSFVAPSTAACGPGAAGTSVVVSWATSGAKQVWAARGSGDAVGGGEEVPLSGNQTSFSTPIPIDCTGNSDVFTLTLVGNNGEHVSRTWSVTVSNQGPGKGHGHGGKDNGQGGDN